MAVRNSAIAASSFPCLFRAAKVAMGLCEVGFELDGVAEFGDRRLQLSLVLQSGAALW